MLGRSCRRWSTYISTHHSLRHFIHAAAVAACRNTKTVDTQALRGASQSSQLNSTQSGGALQTSVPGPSKTDTDSSDVRKKGLRPVRNSLAQRLEQSNVPQAQKEPPLELLTLINEMFAPGISTKRIRVELIRQIREHPSWNTCLASGKVVSQWADSLACSRTPILSQHLLTLALALGTHIKHNVFERVVYNLAEHRHWDLALAIIALAKHATGKLTTRLLNWRVTALAKSKQFALLDGVLDEFTAEGLDPTHRTFRILIQAHLRNHDIAKARSAMQAMTQRGFALDESIDVAVVSAYRGLGPDKRVQDNAYAILNQSHPSAATVALNGLVRLFLDRNDIDGAFHVIEYARQGGKGADGKQSQRPHEEASDAVAIFDQRKAVRADIATYTMLINHVAKLHDSRRLFDLIDRVNAEEIVPDAKLAAALVRAFYSTGLEHVALSVAYEICSPNGLSISAFEDITAGPFKKRRCFKRYQGVVTVDVFNSILQGAVQRYGLKVVPKVIRLMHKMQLNPDSSTLDILSAYLLKQQDVRWRDIARAMRCLLRYEVEPSQRLYHALVAFALRRRKGKGKTTGWHALMARDWTKSSHALLQKSKYIKYGSRDPFYQRVGSFDSLLRVVARKLGDRGINPDRATFALRMQSDAMQSSPTTVTQTMHTMIELGMHPTSHHFASLLQAHTLAGNMRGALSIFREAASYKITPNVVHYTVLIHGYARIGRPDMALRTFRKMLHDGVEPDAAAVDAVTAAFFAVRAFGLARRVLLDLWPMVAPFPEHLRDASLKTLAKALRATQDYKDVSGLLADNQAGDASSAELVEAIALQDRNEIRRQRERRMRRCIGKIVRLWRWSLRYHRLSSASARARWKVEMNERRENEAKELNEKRMGADEDDSK